MGISEEIIAQGEQILEFIPQRSPIVMVDTLYSSNEAITVTGLNIKEDNIFCSNGEFTEPGLIENIAQSAATRIGYECKKAGVPVPLGFIGSIKNANFYKLPSVHSHIKTEIALLHEVMECTIISGKVTCNGELIADCEMKVFVQK